MNPYDAPADENSGAVGEPLTRAEAMPVTLIALRDPAIRRAFEAEV